METDPTGAPARFSDLPLIEPLLTVLEQMGHTDPTPIQAQLIPHLAAGRDVVGQAQTGTGKTGAFALPILSLLDHELQNPQALVLVPTRELALQVAAAFEQYGSAMHGLKVLAIYGGSDYTHQFRRLNRGVHVVVGTPGRVMDHMRKGSLILDDLATVVLDEADEMLRMGFLEDVEWILEQTPPGRQVALFSATLPPAVRKIARTHLREPAEITIEAATTTVAATRQRYLLVDESHKVDALCRVLESEPTDGVLVFVRTRQQTTEVAEQLAARGFRAAALSGELDQARRERTVGRLRQGRLDILVATDVAARGLDIDRLSHVVNLDIPLDPEAYVHRIGRTGRAGREGEAILFVTPAQRRLLRAIEQTTRQPVARMDPPDVGTVNEQRIARFLDRVTAAREDTEQLEIFAEIIDHYCGALGVSELEVAAALAKLAQGDEPLLLDDLPDVKGFHGRDPRGGGPRRPPRRSSPLEGGFERYQVAIGEAHGVRPGNLVGAIANEVGLPGRAVGRIDIHQDFSLVDLPAGLPDHVLKRLQQVRVFGVPLQLRPFTGQAPAPARTAGPRRPAHRKGRPGPGPKPGPKARVRKKHRKG